MRRALSVLLLLSLAAGTVCGCAGTPGETGDTIVAEPLGGDPANGARIAADGYALEIYRAQDGYSLRVTNGEGNEIFANETPAVLRLKARTADAERSYEAKYDSVTIEKGVIRASAVITSRTESVVRIDDVYSGADGMVDVTRTVTVVQPSGDEAGFSSVFVLYSVEGDGLEDLDWFIPGVWNKDTSYEIGEIGKSYDRRAITVRDTSTGLPVVTGCTKTGGDYITLGRINPVVSSDVSDRDTPDWLVDENYLCGSVGMLRNGRPGAAYVYPASVEPYVYYTFRSICKRFHPMKAGFSSSYTVSVFAGRGEDYNSVMTESYKKCFSRQKTPDYAADLGLVRSAVMTTFNEYWDSAKTPYFTIYGLPYGCFLSDGHVESGLTMEMGFVGAEIPVAYQMMLYGYQTGNSEFINRGRSMADMWAERSGNPSGTVNAFLLNNGTFHNIPCYLRRMTDGMEGMLDCVILGEEKGEKTEKWLDIAVKYADFLVRAQNADGSFYRAYDKGGNLFEADNVYGQIEDIDGVCADTKASTPVPVRFLVRMYSHTGDDRYLNAALKAASYCLENLVPAGKYAGAVCDGKARTDRETGICAMYGFSELYAVTGEKRFLDAACQAAVYSASWTMLYDYRAAVGDEKVMDYFIENAVTAGLSFISSDHSGFDNFMAYTYFDFYRLYVWTGDVFFRDFALFIQNCTKRTMNYNGHMGYTSPGLAPEAMALCDFRVFMAGQGRNGETGVWLPWCSMSCLEPVTRMTKVFGTPYVDEADGIPREQRLAMIAAESKR